MKNIFRIGVFTCFCSIVILMGCGCSNEIDSHIHDEAEMLTVYGENIELYAEVMPLVVGDSCEIVAHFTKLDNFKPLDSAKVVMTLKIGGFEQQVAVEDPLQSGIYKFKFIPKSAGVGMLIFEITTDRVERLRMDHIHVYVNHEELHKDIHNHDHGDISYASANAIVFAKEQSWKVDFATEVVEAKPFGRVIKTSAQVLPSQGDEREVSAKASGIVVFNNPNLVEGTKVGRGQNLFSIESSGMADNNMGVRFREAAAEYSLARDEYDRKLKLSVDNIVTESELQRAKMELETAEAVYDNLKNNFSSHGEFVSAPMSGYVQRISVRNGTYVEAGQPIMLVSQNRDLFVRADVQPRYFKDLSHIVGATMQLMNNDEVYDLKDLQGELVSYGRSLDIDNPMIPVTFKFRNSVDVMSGGFVTLYIRTQSDEKVLTVSNSGIIEVMGTYFVFVQITPELFEKRTVKLGVTDGVRTVIESGIKEGERVVSLGAIMVKLAQASATLDPHAGHIH